ncbi:unnamed protein product [Dovyalis caffra]|uniref:Uncharacterized protein n=1 Tax=Dovyalis caffra TaxID=77055 RepID=A0AAV1SRD6_9ROSI|nr:unnamed protein product [Dovyalis caffra]
MYHDGRGLGSLSNIDRGDDLGRRDGRRIRGLDDVASGSLVSSYNITRGNEWGVGAEVASGEPSDGTNGRLGFNPRQYLRIVEKSMRCRMTPLKKSSRLREKDTFLIPDKDYWAERASKPKTRRSRRVYLWASKV